MRDVFTCSFASLVPGCILNSGRFASACTIRMARASGHVRTNSVARLLSLVASGFAACGAFVSTANAQWTSDTSVNTPVFVGAGDQNGPLWGKGPVEATGGTSWVVYNDNVAGLSQGYKHAIQLLGPDGAALLSPAAVLSPLRTNTATFLIDFDVNSAGDAIVAYDNNAIYVQKVTNANGVATKNWGGASADGLLIPGSSGALGPQVVALEDGGCVVCWGSGATLNFQRVLSNGTFGPAWQLTEIGRAQLPADMVRSGDGFIMMWVRAEGTNFVTSHKDLKINKWSASGAASWGNGTPLDVYASSATPQRGIQTAYYPKLLSDGNNGAIAAWYDNATTRNAWLQHVDSNGTFRFAANGLAVSTTAVATELRLSASVAFDAISGDYTLAYQTSNANQSQFGLGAQRINSAGSLLWNGGAGVILQPFTGNPSSFVSVDDVQGQSIVTWLQYAGGNGPMGVLSTRLDASGAPTWNPTILEVATNATTKGRQSTINNPAEGWIASAWSDGAFGSQDVKAMRINVDGTLGQGGPTCPACAADFDQDGGVTGGDIAAFFAQYEAGAACADVDLDGGITGGDVAAFFTLFEAGGC